MVQNIATTNWKYESDTQQLGRDLMDKNLLKVFPTSLVTYKRENAYRMMTILDPLPDDDDMGITSRETNLFRYIQSCIAKKEEQLKVEGSTYHTTTVFTSLGLLYNVCMCKTLEWKVMVTSDGTDHTTNNNWQLLTMGCFSINEKG